MFGLDTGKSDEDPSINEGTRMVTTFPSLKVYGDVSRCLSAANCSAVPGRIMSTFKHIQAFIVVLVA